MRSLVQDLRFALRSLRRKPWFALVAIPTLALAMGANATIFSFVDAVLLKPLPFEDSNRLVALWDFFEGRKVRVSGFNFRNWQEGNTVFEQMALYASSRSDLQLEEGPIQVPGSAVTREFFPILGLDAQLGRTLLPEDYETASPLVTVLSHSLWSLRLGSDPGVIGTTISLGGRPAVVVGVMPPRLMPMTAWASGRVEFSADKDFYWLPLKQPPRSRSHVHGVLAKLREEVPLDEARSRMETLVERLEEEFPGTNTGFSVAVIPLAGEAFGRVQRSLLVLLGAVAFVLLIACVNVANLMLARFESRRRELTLRSILGAGKWRLWRQFLVEGTVVALVGGAFGVFLAYWGVRLLPFLSPGEVVRLNQASLDLRVLGATFFGCVVIGLALGTLTALRIGRRHSEALRYGQQTEGPGRTSFRQFLVALETGLAVVLVIGSGLMVQSFARLQAVDPGFRPDHILTVDLLHLAQRYRDKDQLTAFYDEAMQQLGSLPGVTGVAAAYDHPMESNWGDGFRIENRPAPQSGRPQSALFRTVTAGYFEVMGIPLIAGRTFKTSDDSQSPGALIVNQAFADRYFTNEDPLGKRVTINPTRYMWQGTTPPSYEIVGLVGDVRFSGLRSESQPAYYVPFHQIPQNGMTLFVRSGEENRALLAAIRHRLNRIDPTLPISGTSSMPDILFRSLAQPRFNLIILGAFAGVALLMAAIGMWGVLSDNVRSRSSEIGIRMALGAGKVDVLRSTLIHGLKPALIGVVIGLGAALGLSRLLGGLLFAVSPTDPATYALVPLLLLIVSVLACLLPACRAATTDPMQVLRYE